MNCRSKILCAALLCFGLSACVPVLIGGAAAGGYYLGKDDRSADQIARDGTITARVKSRLIGDKYVDAFDINVDTHAGVVTLKGDVNNNIAREQAQKLAAGVDGVTSVDNQIKVIRKVAAEPAKTTEKVETVEAVDTVDTVETFRTVGTDETAETVETGETVDTVDTVVSDEILDR